jgi:N4-gp56 family major capsid protein
MNTNFAKLTGKEKVVWSKDVWSAARDKRFISKFTGTGEDNVIQRITELTKTEKGERALMFLVADLVGDGVIGDNEREGNEEALQIYDQEITIDMISNQTKNKGKLSDQKHVVRFREQSRDKLAYWLASRMDQLAFLTMSGIAYTFTNNGAARVNSQFPDLAFASDVTAPSAKRHLNWTGTALEPGNTAGITTAYLPTYKMIVALAAYAKDHYIKPIIAGGKEYYVLFVRPGTIAQLKQDSNYIKAITDAYPRGKDNPFFTGGTVTVDGVVLHETRYVFSTSGAVSGSAKWGAGFNVEGTRSLLCGSQALGLCDLGSPDWVEKGFDYDSKQGISIDKMFGLLRPKFHSIYDGSVEDFSIVSCDHHLPFV